MYKNQAGTLKVFAFNRFTNAPVLADAANITCKVSLDGGARPALADTNPTEMEDGYYLFNVLASENNGDTADFFPESTTSGAQVIAVEHRRYLTNAANILLTPEAFLNLDPSIVTQNTFVYFNEETRTYTLTMTTGVFDGNPMTFILNDEDGITLKEITGITSTTNTATVILTPVPSQTGRRCGTWSLRRTSDGYVWISGPAVQRHAATLTFPGP